MAMTAVPSRLHSLPTSACRVVRLGTTDVGISIAGAVANGIVWRTALAPAVCQTGMGGKETSERAPTASACSSTQGAHSRLADRKSGHGRWVTPNAAIPALVRLRHRTHFRRRLDDLRIRAKLLSVTRTCLAYTTRLQASSEQHRGCNQRELAMLHPAGSLASPAADCVDSSSHGGQNRVRFGASLTERWGGCSEIPRPMKGEVICDQNSG